jgi:Fe(3+) dicitrate transport protein
MKKSTLIVTALLAYLGAFAQTGSIKGKVLQGDSTSVLPGITVYLDGSNQGTATNGNGQYALKDIPEGTYTLVASSIGYITERKEVTVATNETTVVDFIMFESISTLSEVTVMTVGNVGLKDIPGSVHYISPKEIEKFSYTDINRTLRAVPGINIQEEDGFGLRPNIGLRGTGVERSSKITVMEDGVLMAPAPYAAPAAYYFPTIGRMQGVEILKGSSQIKYGPYTTGGAINLISTQIPEEFRGRVSLLAGSFGSRNLHAFVGNSHKNFAYMVETFQYGSDGFKQLDGGGNTGFDKKDFLAKFRVNTNPNAKIYQSLSFKIGQAVETSDETYLGLTQEDFEADPLRRYAATQRDQMNTEQLQLSATHVAIFSEIFDIKTTAYRTEFSRNWYKLDKIKDSSGEKISISSVVDNPSSFDEAYSTMTGQSSSIQDALYVKANNRTYYSQGVQTVLGFNFSTGNVLHNIDLGFRVHQDQIDRFQWIDVYAMDNGVMELTNSGTPGTESNRVETADALASYIQYQLRFGKFTATPGLRYENIRISREDYGTQDPDREGSDLSERSNTVDVVIPGIGMDYRFNKYISTFAGVHKGFAPPGSKEGTLPEESINYEIGVRYSKNAFYGEMVVFLNDYSNLLGTDLEAAGGGGTGDLFNGGEVQANGLELQLTYDLLASKNESELRLPLTLVYTYTDAEFANNFESDFDGWGTVAAGDQFPYLANHQFAVILGFEHYKFSFNLSGRYMDEMRTVPGQGEIPANERTDAYFVMDASASYNVHKYVALFANATNLTEQVYVVARRPAGLRPGMPRAFNMGIKANF